MEGNIFERLIKKNEFPMLFIGSGISKRYLNGFPSWIELLESFWNELGESTDFYGKYNIINRSLSRQFPDIDEKEIEYMTNVEISTIIKDKYEELFNLGVIEIDGFSTKDAHLSKIDPFKVSIAKRFENYSKKDDSLQEQELFKKALLKAQIIITTNYDTFIEDSYNAESTYGVKKYIGQNGFFEETVGYAELFKIHGCVENPNSIIITENDYNLFNANSILISAKIISMLIHSPIIFLGYSLTDLNVRKYIKDFASSIQEEDSAVLVDKLIVVDRVEGEDQLIEEIIYDKELNCTFTYIKTDNYGLVFEYLQKINQGVAPSEIRKFKHIIKQIVVDAGRVGGLKSVLLSPLELEKIEEIIESGGILDQNIVVALGDSKVIFKTPNKLSYLEDYFSEESELTTDVVLRFLATSPKNSRYPFKKFLSAETIQSSTLHEFEKEKLKQRLDSQGDLESQISTIPPSSQYSYDDLSEILGEEFNENKTYGLIAYNIKRLDIHEVTKFIKDEIGRIVELGEAKINTQFRRLLLIYDLYTN